MSIEDLMQATIGAMMGIFADPDDPVAAEQADDTLTALHEALTAAR